MENSFSVTVGGKSAGKVLVKRQGLYYLFSCRCCLTGNIMYRLVVTCGTIQEYLGILVPQEGSFVLQTKLPVKRLGEGNMTFSLVPKQNLPAGSFVPICPEEPFAYLSRLKQSFLIKKEGQPGIFVEKQQKL